MQKQDPFEYIMNIGSSQEGILLVASPFILLCIVAVIFVFLTVRRKKKEIASMENLVDELSSEINDEEISPVSVNKTDYSNSQQNTSAVADVKNLTQDGWLSKLRKGLGKTSSQLQDSLISLFTGKTKLNEEVLEKLHETLYRADIGVNASDRLVEHVRSTLSKEETTSWDNIKDALSEEILQILKAPQVPEKQVNGPLVIMIVGVNGVGKTTTIGKLAAHYLAKDKSVLLCAGDTYRAAAIDQLKIWGERVGVHVVAHQQGADPAATAFDAVKAAKARKIDILLVDTAGRLHSKNDLMDELAKISRVMKKEIPEAPHETWLVIDSTTGQNGAAQVKAFKEVTQLSGIVVTKLDGTAKGGIIISISDQFNVPVKFIGVGEQINDLREFKPEDYVDALLN